MCSIVLQLSAKQHRKNYIMVECEFCKNIVVMNTRISVYINYQFYLKEIFRELSGQGVVSI